MEMQFRTPTIGNVTVAILHTEANGPQPALFSCANLCFGGAKRNRLFMAASQSLYAVYTATQGAAPG